ncbi:DMT family transporter [Thermodesulfobacteriota bacterium]
MYKAQLRWQPITYLLILSLVWGANMAFIKIGARDLPSLFMAGLRSLVAGLCLFIWMKIKGVPLFPSKRILFHGIVTGILFGSEFGFVYMALELTQASRTYILLYTAPFFAALGAHLFLKGDSLNVWKTAGLLLAFTGVVLLFIGDLGAFSIAALPGDLMAMLGGLLWGSTTIYIKKYLSHRTTPLQTLFYQVCFSAPLLFIMSTILENFHGITLSPASIFSIFYQCIIIAFLSYLAWFELIHRYPVSYLHAFTFFTPVFGVVLSGVMILGETVSPGMITSLFLVSLGMVILNRQPEG